MGVDEPENDFFRAAKTIDQIIEPEKVLGMWWQTADDTFTFSLKYTKVNVDVLNGNRLPTKRELLRLIMSIFDPLGLLAFFTVNVRIIMQDVWRSGIGWDDIINEEHAEKWNTWLTYLPKVSECAVPRCYFSNFKGANYKLELHVFVDASERACAAVAFFRSVCDGNVHVSLVCSKTKVAPIRPISIPRMELTAALMGARLANRITEGHDVDIHSTSFWTDSKTVLSWIRADATKFKQFVMFRVAEIQETTNVDNWRYVSTEMNVADYGTKWRVPFKNQHPWLKGPDFLWLQSARVPEHSIDSPSIEVSEENESKYLVAHVQNTAKQPDIQRFSRWEGLLRIMGYVKRFLSWSRSKGALSSEELRWSKWQLLKRAQEEVFSEEIHLLQQNTSGKLPKSSPLRFFSPFVDSKGMLRMRGRLENALVIDDETKNPLILPKRHHVVHLLVDWYHRKFRHGNHETVINEIFKKFHVIGLRNLLRTVRSECQLCRVRRASPDPPEMAVLPVERLSPYTRPFSYVGIDFFGPFLVSIGRRSEKRYGVVFTCLTCRAIHLEVAYSLTTSSCVMAIRNFISRRGMPVNIFSDNGTNLRASEKELREAYKSIEFSKLDEEFTTPHCQWTFLPPASPHMGGAWERLVRSIKTVLYNIINTNTKLSDERLYNLFAEVESIVNSRPLTYISLNTAEEEALTPNHFLLGSSSGSKPPGKFDDRDEYLRHSWRQIQVLADRFWRRWVAEVMPTLTRRSKWHSKARALEIGDVVVIVDQNLPRHCWPKGIIVDVVKAKDGQVRSAYVKTKGGVYHRPAVKLAVLNVRNRRE